MIRVAITGPESSGKTTLAEALSAELESSLFPEFARKYLETTKGNYSYDDLEKIALGHSASFLKSDASVQIVDTDFIVMKIWSEVKYGHISDKILNLCKQNHFDLHILCTPDIPWEEDPLREHPNERQKLFDVYCKELTAFKKPFIVVSGTRSERLKKSLEAIRMIQS